MKTNSPSLISPNHLLISVSTKKEQPSVEHLTELFYNSVFDKIEAKPQILKQITALNSKIYQAEKKLQNSKEKVEQLEGGKAAKLPLIGILIKYLFKWYNKHLITQEESQRQRLQSKENRYKQGIADLQKLLPTKEEEKPSTIFAMEYQMRLALEKDFPGKDKYLTIFNNKIRPLIEQTKRSLIQTRHHFVAHAAASKGKAAQAGFKALKKLSESHPIIKNSKISNQQVFLLPKEGVVFKHSSERAKEEEAIANALLELMSQESVVGSFSIQKASIDKFGIKIVVESELSNIQAKPFVKRMILMKDLNKDVREVLLNRLTPNAEFNAILTGEVQLLDMHSGNLGIAPESNTEYEQFKNICFSLPNGPKNFNDLVIDYLAGKVSLDIPIGYKDQGVVVHKPLKDLPELQKALNVRWKFVIFDTDLSLSEDNRLQMQTYNNIKQHLIPLRSVLLATNWKDKPLNEETIERLIDSDERDHQVQLWIKKKDAPIYKQISPNLRKEVEEYVAPFIQKYNLSEPRKNGEEVTIKSLSEKFSQEICDPIHHDELWQKLEDALSYVPIRQDDTWETLAKRYDQNINELKNMNSGNLLPGKKVKLNYDLTSSSPTAVNKRKRIAYQLFPRISHRQQEALLERQRNRKKYLHNYQELAKSRLEGEELLEQLKDFIKEPTTPLSSLRKDELLLQLGQKQILLKSPEKLAKLKQEICKECHPTYFNLAKTMYPLLADAYALNLAIHQDAALAGKHIGLFSMPLEELIKLAKSTSSSHSSAHQLAQILQFKIDSISDPAFFGDWG